MQRHRVKKPRGGTNGQAAAERDREFCRDDPIDTGTGDDTGPHNADNSTGQSIEEQLELHAAAFDALARTFVNEVARAGGGSQSDQRRRNDARQLSAWAERALTLARRLHDEAREPVEDREVTRLRLV